MNETIPLVEGLLKLHDFQLLTDGSQPYEHERTFEEDGKWTEYQQRPFVTFTMPGQDSHGLEFFKRLQKRSEIVVRASEIHPFRELQPSHEEVAVTRKRVAKATEDLEAGTWRGLTWVLNPIDVSEDDFYCLDAMKRSKPLFFQVAAKEWGVRLDLLSIILDVAVECDLPRVSQTV